MARPSGTAAFLLLLLLPLSLLAVAHCRSLETTLPVADETGEDGFLRLLPSHHRHRHGLFHRRHHKGGEAAEEEEVKKPVGEPDPDAAAVKRWRKETLRRMFRRGLRHHHKHEDEEERHDHDHDHGHDHDHDHLEKEEKKKKKMRKPFHHDLEELNPVAEPDPDRRWLTDSDDEMVRRFRKAISHHLFRHHHHRAEEKAHGEQPQQQEEEGGVMTWIRGLVNRF